MERLNRKRLNSAPRGILPSPFHLLLWVNRIKQLDLHELALDLLLCEDENGGWVTLQQLGWQEKHRNTPAGLMYAISSSPNLSSRAITL